MTILSKIIYLAVPVSAIVVLGNLAGYWRVDVMKSVPFLYAAAIAAIAALALDTLLR